MSRSRADLESLEELEYRLERDLRDLNARSGKRAMASFADFGLGPAEVEVDESDFVPRRRPRPAPLPGPPTPPPHIGVRTEELKNTRPAPPRTKNSPKRSLTTEIDFYDAVNYPQKQRSKSPQPVKKAPNSPQPAKQTSNLPQPAKQVSKPSQPVKQISKSPQPTKQVSKSPQPIKQTSKSPQPIRQASRSPQPVRQEGRFIGTREGRFSGTQDDSFTGTREGRFTGTQTSARRHEMGSRSRSPGAGIGVSRTSQMRRLFEEKVARREVPSFRQGGGNYAAKGRGNARQVSNHLDRSFVSQRSMSVDPFERDLIFKPMLSRKSLMIAEKLGPSSQRLTSFKSRQSDEEEIERALRRGAKPRVNRRSAQLDRQRSRSIGSRFQSLYEHQQIMAQNHRAKIEKKLREEEEKNRQAEARSRIPRVSPNSAKLFASDVDVQERNRIWDARKEERLNQQRKMLQEAELKDCSFKPKTLRLDPNIFSPLNTSKFLVEGVSEHLRRTQAAKKLRSEKSIELSREKYSDVSRNFDSRLLFHEVDSYSKKHRTVINPDSSHVSEHNVLKNLQAEISKGDKTSVIKTMMANLKKLNGTSA